MGRAACEHAAYGLADAPTPDMAFESFLARTLYGRNRPTNRSPRRTSMDRGQARARALSCRPPACVGGRSRTANTGAGRRRMAKALSRSARNLRGFFPWLSFSLVATAICDLIANPCDYHCS